MATVTIAVNWPVPTGLTVEKVKNGNSINTIWRWDNAIDLTSIPATFEYWRVSIQGRTYIVKNNPIFTFTLPLGCCKLCVKVQSVYSVTNTTTTVLALSSFCDEVCVECLPDLYCENVKSTGNKTVTKNYGSSNMRYARAIRRMGKNAFR